MYSPAYYQIRLMILW